MTRSGSAEDALGFWRRLQRLAPCLYRLSERLVPGGRQSEFLVDRLRFDEPAAEEVAALVGDRSRGLDPDLAAFASAALSLAAETALSCFEPDEAFTVRAVLACHDSLARPDLVLAALGEVHPGAEDAVRSELRRRAAPRPPGRRTDLAGALRTR